MTSKIIEPIVQQYNENNWEFIYPSSIDNEKISDEFWHAVKLLDNDDQMAEKVFKKLITKHPYYIDAYNHLSISFRNQGKKFESFLTAEKSFNLGKNCLPKSFNLKKDKLPWSNINNRPFLRACQSFGLECQYHQNYSQAIEIYKLNLALNENDNQGIRYLLLETLFAAKDYKQAQQLLNKYSDDFSIEFKFGLVAISILQDNYKRADKYLEEAIQTNKFFIEEVIKDRHLKPSPFRIPGMPNFDAGIPDRSIQQAFEYWERNKQLYKTNKIIDYIKARQKLTLK
ncbi:tetratricopeptide repeat protein [Flavobacterium sp. N502536]|uniref:tetratricopeptide repeat protein n=1 Tax=Flavobacterium sp. N502536 TaxID=2986837 RepID=UPI002221391A|nr:tetratricopeptide repeat protein [Flavobacterium sp. N502536]